MSFTSTFARRHSPSWTQPDVRHASRCEKHQALDKAEGRRLMDARALEGASGGVPSVEAQSSATHSDDELMVAYARGGSWAFDELYARFGTPLYNYLLRACRSPVLAADLTQETWLSLVRSRAGYEARSRFSAYLFHIAHNKLVDHWRTTVVPHDSLDELVAEPVASRIEQPEVIAEGQESAHRFVKALMSLPHEQREAFLLQQEADLSLDEIAVITGVGRETVKSRLRYAMAKLRLEMSDD